MEKKKPIIGVISLYDKIRHSIGMLPGYMDGITAAGGIPVMIPLAIGEQDYLQIKDGFDGFLFTGGDDLSPALYGEETLDCCGLVSEERDRIDGLVYRYAEREDKPVLGICRGLQFINAVRGGTLYQDIPAQRPDCIDHLMKPPYDRSAHTVDITPGTPLAACWGVPSNGVNSCHHQGIRTIGRGLDVMAVSEDGLVEAMYDPSKPFFWLVQWHPEMIYQKDPRELDLFRAFVQACEK